MKVSAQIVAATAGVSVAVAGWGIRKRAERSVRP
jgi:hypothetical protein